MPTLVRWPVSVLRGVTSTDRLKASFSSADSCKVGEDILLLS